MRRAVVAYPILAEHDRQWMEGVRARHDPSAGRIAAHFTLVFPTEVAEAPLVARVRNALQSRASIPVAPRRAGAFPNVIDNSACVVLLVDEGRAELMAVHDTLYDGILAARRRRDIPFVPHVTVGVRPHLGECERIASQRSAEPRIVRALLNSVAVIEVGEDSLDVRRQPAADRLRRRCTLTNSAKGMEHGVRRGPGKAPAPVRRDV